MLDRGRGKSGLCALTDAESGCDQRALSASDSLPGAKTQPPGHPM